MIVTTIRIQTTPENRKELMQTFRSLSQPIQGVHGCRSCRIYREVDNEGVVIVIQEWDSRNHLEQHLRSDEFAVMIGAMSLLKQPETVEYQVLSHVAGSLSVEAIKARNFKENGDNHEFPKTAQHAGQRAVFHPVDGRDHRSR